MAIGDAWALHKRSGRRVAIGDGTRLVSSELDLGIGPWLHTTKSLAEDPAPVWLANYPGRRPYIDYAAMRRGLGRRADGVPDGDLIHHARHYLWRLDYRPRAAKKVRELPAEQVWAIRQALPDDFLLVDPTVKGAMWAKHRPRQWPWESWEALVQRSRLPVVQIGPEHFPALHGASLCRVVTRTFREALAILRRARVAVVHHGGLSHAAAATRTPCVALFGGWAPPAVLGYPAHANLTGASQHTSWCGSLDPCAACDRQMRSISVAAVLSACERVTTS